LRLPRAEEEEFMAKKPAAKKKSSTKKVSVKAIRRAINGVKKKMTGVNTPKAKKLRQKLTTFDASINCGQSLFLDIGN
jgi:hypothetical protein